MQHLLQVHGGLHAVVHGRVGEDGLVVEQVALTVETDHLTACAEAGVDAHDALLSQWCREQQLAQVLGKHTDGLLVGLLLAQGCKLRLYGGFQQSLVAVLHGFVHQSPAGCLPVDVVVFQQVEALLVVGGYADAQYSLGLAPAHGQQSVAAAPLQRFLPVEVVAVLGSLVGRGLALHHLRHNHGLAAEHLSHLLTRTLRLVDLFGYDVLSAFQCRFHVGHSGVGVDILQRCAFGVALPLLQQELG